MTRAIFLAVTVVLLTAAAKGAGTDVPSPSLSFLQVNKDYVIRLPASHDIFKTTESGISSTMLTTADGKTQPGQPASWTATLSLTVFHVERFGGGSWVLVSHPINPHDAFKWQDQRRALAVLASPQAETIKAKPNGPEQLEKLKRAAGVSIRTTQTWLNLSHAVAISDVPTEEPEPRVSVTFGARTPLK